MKILSSLLLAISVIFGASFASAGTANHEKHTSDHSGIMASDFVIRATTPNAGATAAYGHIHNHGNSDDRLIGAHVSFAKKAEIHEMTLEGDVMKMRQITGGLLIPAGEMVDLKNGAEHVMIMGLSEQIKTDNSYEITLTFEQAGAITLTAGTISLSGKKTQDDHSHHNGHSDHNDHDDHEHKH